MTKAFSILWLTSVQLPVTILAWRGPSRSVWDAAPLLSSIKILIKVEAIGAESNAGSLLWEVPAALSRLELRCPV